MSSASNPEVTVGEKLTRCQEWLQSQKIPPETSFFMDFIETQSNADNDESDDDDDDDFKEATYSKIRRRLRKKNVADEVLRLKCEWKNCNHVTKKYDDFQAHVKTHISQVDIVTSRDNGESHLCLWKMCKFQSTNGKDTIRHINFHAYHAKLKALGCNVRDRYNLNDCKVNPIQRNKLPLQSEDYICMWTGCNSQFNNIQVFFDHVHGHMLGADVLLDKMVSCGWLGCDQVCRNTSKLRMHSRKHTGEKVTACPSCGKMFASNAVFEDHCMRQVEVTSDFRCDTCGKLFSSERILRSHARRHINSFKCSFCDMTSSAPSDLIRHIRYCHIDFKPFQCHICPYKAVSKSDIDLHILCHEGKKKKSKNMLNDDNSKMRLYACQYCEMCFSVGSNLTKHLMKIHGFTRASGFQRFRYAQTDDGYYRLIPVRFESLEVSNQIMEEQNHKKDSPLTNDEDISTIKEYKLVQFRKGDPETPTLFAILPLGENENELLQEITLEKNHDDSHGNDGLFAVDNEHNKSDKKSTKRNKKRPNDDYTLPKNKRKKLTQSNVQSSETVCTKNIQISIEEIDHAGNVIKSEVVESHELAI